MSLFVAIRPDDRATEDLQHAVDRVRRQPSAEGLRWQPPSQWHVTLAFLGDPADEVVDAVAERLDLMRGRPVVEGLHLAGAGCFGRQILWIGLGGDDAIASLTELAAAIPPLVRGTGAHPDRRPWRPHLTVARARHGDARPVADALTTYAGPSWTATGVLLVRSTGGPRPAHAVVHAVSLEGGDGTG
jgi:RNA 2',3'-cyclic 3'-phosphodiesterase